MPFYFQPHIHEALYFYYDLLVAKPPCRHYLRLYSPSLSLVLSRPLALSLFSILVGHSEADCQPGSSDSGCSQVFPGLPPRCPRGTPAATPRDQASTPCQRSRALRLTALTGEPSRAPRPAQRPPAPPEAVISSDECPSPPPPPPRPRHRIIVIIIIRFPAVKASESQAPAQRVPTARPGGHSQGTQADRLSRRS